MSKLHLGKMDKKRDFWSFVLFVCIAIFSISLCCRAFIINPNTYVGIVTSQDYVASLCDDVQQYADDMCRRYYIDDDIDISVSYDDVLAVETAYAREAMGITDNDYSAMQIAQQDLNTNIYNSYAKELAHRDIKLTDAQTAGLHELAGKISDYTVKRMELSFAPEVKDFAAKWSKITFLLTLVLGIIILILCVYMYYMGRTRYRSLRSIAVSCGAAALFDFALAVGVMLVKASKDLVLYPLYLRDAIMVYIDRSIQTVAMSGVVLIAVFLVLIATIWHKKYGR